MLELGSLQESLLTGSFAPMLKWLKKTKEGARPRFQDFALSHSHNNVFASEFLLKIFANKWAAFLSSFSLAQNLGAAQKVIAAQATKLLLLQTKMLLQLPGAAAFQ